MPAVSPSPFGPKPQFTLSSGLPAVGYKLFFYLAGSVGTKQATYTDSTGTVANTNPVILDVNGTPPDELWFVTAQAYKVVYAPAADTDPPTSAIWTVDNLRGIGDATITPSEWVDSSLVPTFISASSFSLVGDQTSTFHVGRRVKTTNSSGFIYSTITGSAFGTVTTITLDNDSGVLDSGLSAVAYGIISAVNSSDPFEVSGSGDVTGPASAVANHIVQFNGATGKVIKDGLLLDTDGTLTGNSDTAVASQKATKTYVDAHITGTGDVVGPAGAIDSNLAQFDGVTGKLIKGGVALDTDGTLAANSNTRIATQNAVKTYVDASATTPGHLVEEEGTPLTQRANLNFTGAGVAVTDAGGKTVVTIAGSAGTGDVVGPASSTSGHFATYNGATGKLLQDTLALDTDTTLAADSDTRVASQKAVKAYVTASAGGGGSSITGTTGAAGGNAVSTGGTSTTSANAGGESHMVGGTPGATGVGGISRITGGAGGSTSGAGGAVILAGGVPVDGVGGAISLTAASSVSAATARTGGAVSITSGVGSISTPTSGAGGLITITAGAGGSGGSFPGAGGGITILAGANGGGASALGGTIAITAGLSGSGATGGAVNITGGGAGAGSGTGGPVTIQAGGAGTGGTLSLLGGTASNVGGGPIVMTAGASIGASAGPTVTITGGAGGASNGAGGAATVKGGPGAGAGTGGAVNITGGAPGATGAAGAVNIAGGTPVAGNGANVSIAASSGVGTTKTGGNVIIQPGAATGAANPGNIQLDGGRGGALATTAIGGFVTIPTCAGTPTGTPVNVPTGSVAMVFDTTGVKLWIFSGTWKGVVVA